MTDAKVEKYRRIRGAILKLLAHEHPGSIDTKVLHYLLDDLGYSIALEELCSHLSYLSQKGFLKKAQRETTGVRISMAVIEPKGLDVLDGLISECGVDVRF